MLPPNGGQARDVPLVSVVMPCLNEARSLPNCIAKAKTFLAQQPFSGEIVIAATRQARAMLCKADEVNFLGGPGRGVILIKLQKEDDRLLGFIASTGDRDLLTVETTRGAEQTISTAKYGVTGRGGKGRELLQRGEFTRVVPQVPDVPQAGGE